MLSSIWTPDLWGLFGRGPYRLGRVSMDASVQGASIVILYGTHLVRDASSTLRPVINARSYENHYEPPYACLLGPLHESFGPHLRIFRAPPRIARATSTNRWGPLRIVGTTRTNHITLRRAAGKTHKSHGKTRFNQPGYTLRF